jgi:hypothetical protein
MNHVPRLAILLLATAAPAAADPVTIAYRNTVPLPTTTTDQFGASFTITGMSGIAYRGGSDFMIVMDNSNKLVRLTVQLAANGSVSQASVPGGLSLSQTHDFEGIALAGPASDIVFLSEEDSPAVRVFYLSSGCAAETLPVPPVFANIRPNFGFESLARSFDGAFIWTANEEALSVDGPLSTTAAGSTVRILQYSRGQAGYTPGPEYAYTTAPIHGAVINGSRSGLSDLVSLPDGRLLSLERSLAFDLAGFYQTRIYLVDFANASDVSSLPALAGATFTPVVKTLLHTGSYNNLEGLCLGPPLGGGHYSLLGIIDDGDPLSTNQLVAFEITGIDPPSCLANCDASSAAPTLNINDFLCFINAFAAGEFYANCDESSSFPILNVNDFTCFLNAFATGCP